MLLVFNILRLMQRTQISTVQSVFTQMCSNRFRCCLTFFIARIKGTLLFDGNAKEALEKAKEANNGELKIKGGSVTWQVLEGDEEKQVLKNIIQAQQESYNRSRGRGRASS